MAIDYAALLDDLDRNSEGIEKNKIIRAPFKWPGGKSRSVANILKYLPYNDGYVEPFSGSAAILLARQKSKLEVLNDRYSGITTFYRCLANQTKLERLVDRLEVTVHSREEFIYAKENWQHLEDEVERAALWYYITEYSFSSLGRNFGRSTSPSTGIAGCVRNKIKGFQQIHDRLENVQVENQDWFDCLQDYDGSNIVFYCDPPYVDASPGVYTFEMTKAEHQRFIDVVFHLKGFVAVSGYANPLYDNQDWDNRFTWEVFSSVGSTKNTEANSKEGMNHGRSHTEEVLWIKEAK